MNKRKLQTLKGFKDYLPTEAKKRNWLKARLIEIFESWGYEPLETPTLEALELSRDKSVKMRNCSINSKIMAVGK